MGLRCKVGDLCWIVKGYPENIGLIVKVIGPSIRRDRDWFVQSQGGLLQGNGGKDYGGVTTDDALLPIRAEPEAQPAPPVREELPA